MLAHAIKVLLIVLTTEIRVLSAPPEDLAHDSTETRRRRLLHYAAECQNVQTECLHELSKCWHYNCTRTARSVLTFVNHSLVSMMNNDNFTASTYLMNAMHLVTTRLTLLRMRLSELNNESV